MNARGIKTNGIGKRTTAHLNLTRTLADVWGSVHPNHVGQLKPLPRPKSKPKVRGANRIYRLKNADGEYLHQSGQGMTAERSYAWKGSVSQLAKVRYSIPLASGLWAESEVVL